MANKFFDGDECIVFLIIIFWPTISVSVSFSHTPCLVTIIFLNFNYQRLPLFQFSLASGTFPFYMSISEKKSYQVGTIGRIIKWLQITVYCWWILCKSRYMGTYYVPGLVKVPLYEFNSTTNDISRRYLLSLFIFIHIIHKIAHRFLHVYVLKCIL